MPDPQNPYGVTGIQYPTNYQPYSPPPPQIQYPSTYQPYQPPIQEPGISWSSMVPKASDVFTWPNAARFGLSAAGDLVGGAVAAAFPPAAPFTYPAISAFGGGLGEFVGQTFEDKPYNWGLIGTEAAMNPLFPGPNIPGRSAGLKEFGKFAVGSGLAGAQQGAYGSLPRWQAEQGNLTNPSQWELPPPEYFGGQTLAGTVFGGGTSLGLAAGKRGLDYLRAPSPTNAPVTGSQDPFQPSLPGMGRVDFGAQIPEPTMPTRPTVDPTDAQNRVFNQMDAQTQQTIFELTIQRAEAQRAGDITSVTQIENAILEAKMRNAEQQRNWTPPAPPPEAPAPIFDDMGQDQGNLSFGAVRGDRGRFRQPGLFEYTPLTRTGDPTGGPNEWQFPPAPEPPPPDVPVDTPPAQTTTPDIIDMPYNQAELAMRKAEGYKTIPNHRGPNGQLQMVRGAQADMLPPTPTPVAAPVVGPVPGAAAARKVPGKIRQGDDIVVPTDIVNADPNYVSNMAENGYRVISLAGGNTTFRHSSNQGGTRVGSMDIGEMINLLIRGVAQIRNSEMAGKVQSAIAELNRRRRAGETQISPDEFRRVTAGIPNLEDVAQQMGIDLPDVRARVGPDLMQQEPLPPVAMAGHQEQLIRDAQTVAELDALVDQFGDDYDMAMNRDDAAAMGRAYDLNRAVAARRAELENPAPQIPRRRTDHTNWLEANSPEGLQQIESATNYEQLRPQIHEWERQRVAANEAGDRTNGHRLYRMVMAGYDRLNQIRDTQAPLPRQRSAESQAASDAIFDSRLTGAPPSTQQMHGRVGQPTDVHSSMNPQQVSLYELADRMSATTRPSELIAIRTEVEAALADAIQDNFYPGAAYARRLIDDIGRRLGEPTQESLDLQDQPVLGSPVQYGPQAPMKGNLKLSAPAYDRLTQIVEGRAALTKQEKKRLMASDMWQDYGIRTAQAAGHGPPGLSVEKVYSSRDRVVYRNPAGEPIVSAEVRTNPDGTREVPSLGADKTRSPVPPDAPPGTVGTFIHGTLLGRGVHQVGMKLVEMGAAFTSGSTSPFTKNLIQSIMKRVSNGIDESSVELASLIRQLMHIKEVEKTLPRRIRTPEDVAQFIADMMADESAQPELPFEPRAARRESTAAELENVPEQMRLTEEVRAEQMPLPLESAVKDTTASKWTGLMKQLDEMKAPDALYREIIASPNTPPLKAGETWRQRVLKGIAFFESKFNKGIERLGTEGGEEGAINIGGMTDAVGSTIRNFFARGPATPENPKGTPSTFEQLWGLPTAATTIADLSMPLRQGLAAIFTPEWRAGLKPMWQSFWSAEKAREIDQQIRNNKVHQKEFNPSTGKWDPTYAERANMKLAEGSDINSSEHDVAGAWIETGGNLGGVSKKYEQSWGRIAKMSNRAAATFLNHLRTGMLERLSDQAQLMAEVGAETGSVRPNIFKQKVTPEQAAELNPYYNDTAAKVLGDYINTATGRAPLKLDVFGVRGTPQLNLEFAAKAMGMVFFSPRNMFSRARLLWPGTYTVAPPFVRKQYLKSALATGAAWATMTTLAKVGAEALGYDAEVSLDPESADFGKMRIGKTRLDLGGGFLPQYVAMWRLWSGFYRSSSTGQRHAYGQGFRPETERTQIQRFFENKFNPAAKFGYDLLDAAQYTPFHVADRTAQMFVPLVAQDLYEMFKEDPKLIPLLMPPVMLGGGTQIYGRGEQVAKIVPKNWDWVVKGGGVSDIAYPANWQIFGGK